MHVYFCLLLASSIDTLFLLGLLNLKLGVSFVHTCVNEFGKFKTLQTKGLTVDEPASVCFEGNVHVGARVLIGPQGWELAQWKDKSDVNGQFCLLGSQNTQQYYLGNISANMRHNTTIVSKNTGPVTYRTPYSPRVPSLGSSRVTMQVAHSSVTTGRLPPSELVWRG